MIVFVKFFLYFFLYFFLKKHFINNIKSITLRIQKLASEVTLEILFESEPHIYR
jgi:hypothetical protein